MSTPSAPLIFHAPYGLVGDGTAVRDAALVLDPHTRTVLAFGPAAEVIPAHASTGVVVKALRAVIFPGIVNARVRVAQAALRGRVPGGAGFVPWFQRVEELERMLDPDEAESAQGIAADELASAGTIAVGVVGGRMDAVESLARRGLQGWFFAEADANGDATTHEVPAGFRTSTVPRALHAHRPEVLSMLATRARERNELLAMPLLEHAPARALFRDGRGPLRALAADGWTHSAGEITGETAPGESPLDAADRAGLLGPHLIAAGLSDARRNELARLAASGTRIVLTPREDLYVQTLLPPLPDLLAAGLRPALGSGSPAGNTTLDVLAEAATLLARFPGIATGTLFAMASSWGARALGLANIGEFTRGNAPGVVAVEWPERAVGDPHAHVIKSAPATRSWVMR